MKKTNIGDIFGRLTVLRRHSHKSGKKVVARCACGTLGAYFLGNLTRGNTSSCGCLQREIAKAQATTHGMAHKTRVYGIWSKMRARCENPEDGSFADYGGRGITVCARWQDFSLFFQDMGEPPSLTHSINRIENDGNYEPGNCAWATPKEQARNRRSNLPRAFGGKALLICDWAELLGVTRATIRRRFRKWESPYGPTKSPDQLRKA